jgi:hypothetical protein
VRPRGQTPLVQSTDIPSRDSFLPERSGQIFTALGGRGRWAITGSEETLWKERAMPLIRELMEETIALWLSDR